MFKKFLLFILLLLCVFNTAFSYDGEYFGEKDVRVVKTEWFDIIYTPKSEETAKILFEKADGVYKEISEMYGMPIPCRMPVVIVTGVEQFNAYYTNFPYNHIVLYDTGIIDELAVFSETTLSTFRHELTHAFTYNMKNKFWTTVDSIFGDLVSPGSLLFITAGWSEGAAVTSESFNGEGRLNDEFSKQMVRQAKIENQFPKVFDVQGAADIYPVGSFYYFNSAFDQWLQKNYGMEKYAKFWYRCINFQTIGVRSTFKRIYGFPIQQAWDEFKNSVHVPEVYEDAIEDKLVQDFFNATTESSKSKLSSNNKEGALFTNLSCTQKGLYYIDERNDTIYFVPNEKLQNGKIKPKKVYTSQGLNGVKSSSDGRFLALNEYDTNAASIKSKCGIYDTKTGKTLRLKETNVKEPAVIFDGIDYYLVCQKYENQNYSILINKILLNNGRLSKLEEFARVSLKSEVPSDFCDLGKGSFAYINRNGLAYTIQVRDISDLSNIQKTVSLPYERMVVRYLSYSSDAVLHFSYTVPDSMPRYGKYDCSSKEFTLQSKDVSGGVYEPVKMENGQILFAGRFYRQNRLFIGAQNFEAESVKLFGGEEKLVLNINIDEKALLQNKQQNVELPYEKVNPFKYYTKGILVPLSITESPTHLDGNSYSYSNILGLTYMTASPWNAGGLYTLSLGYGTYTNSFAGLFSVSGGTSSSLLSYSVALTSEFDFEGWKQEWLNAQVITKFNPLRNATMYVNAITDTTFGRENKITDYGSDVYFDLGSGFLDDFGSAAPGSKDNYLYSQDVLALGLSTVRNSTAGRYSKTGFMLEAFCYYTLHSRISGGYENDINTADLGANFITYIPRLLPVKNIYSYTYNLPAKLKFSLFPASLSTVMDGDSIMIGKPIADYETILASVRTDLVLLGKEIQKAVSFIPPLYFSNARLSAIYLGVLCDDAKTYKNYRFAHLGSYANMLKSNELEYINQVALRLELGFVPNIGQLARAFQFNCYTQADYTFSTVSDGKINFKLGVEAEF